MNAGRQVTVAVWCGLAEVQVDGYVMPIARSRQVERMLLFRRFPPAAHPKVECVSPPRLMRWSAWLSLAWMAAATVWVGLRARLSPRHRLDFTFGVTAFPHAMLARLAGILAGSATGAWWIGTDLYVQLYRPVLRPIYRSALRGCDLTLTMGSRSTQRLVQLGWDPRRTQRMTAAHDLGRFRPEDRPRRWDVINVSRHDRKHKRLHLLLEAVAIARQRLPDLTCAMVGDGPDRRRLEALSRRLGLSDAVTFLGRRDDVPELLNQGRVFAVCSAWEGLPAALVEAMACGLPVVTSDVSDIPDLARHEDNALVVTDDDPATYARALTDLLTDQALWTKLHEGAMATRRRLEQDDPARAAVEFWDQYFAKLAADRDQAEGGAGGIASHG